MPTDAEKLVHAKNQVEYLRQQLSETERGLLGAALRVKRYCRNLYQRTWAAKERLRVTNSQLGRDVALRKALGRPAGPSDETQKTVSDGYHSSPVIRQASAFDFPMCRRMHITWVVGGFLPKGGGHRNIFRMCYHLETFGHKVSIYVTDAIIGDQDLRTAVHDNFYPIAGPIERYRGEIGETGILVATHWTTVETCLKHKSKAQALAYFVQDYEPMFYPMGSEYLLAAQTYNNDFYHICSGEWIAALIKERHCGRVGHFKFPVDTSIYNITNHRRHPKQIVFFAKPEMPRRCFSIGVQALTIAAKNIPELEVILYGSPEIEKYSLDFKNKKLKFVKTLAALAEIYNTASLGVCFSTTNPSLVPYEMMACGLPVVDLATEKAELNYGGNHATAILAGPDPVDIAKAIVRALSDSEELNRRRKSGLALVAGFPDETQAARLVESHLQRALNSTPLPKPGCAA